MFNVVGTYRPYPASFPLHLDGFVLIYTRIWWASGLHRNSLYEATKTRHFFKKIINFNHLHLMFRLRWWKHAVIYWLMLKIRDCLVALLNPNPPPPFLGWHVMSQTKIPCDNATNDGPVIQHSPSFECAREHVKILFSFSHELGDHLAATKALLAQDISYQRERKKG